MIIWVDDDLFDGRKSDIDLLSLLRRAAQRRHTLVVSISPSKMWSGSAPNFKKWLSNNLTDKLRTEVEFLVERLHLISSNLVTRGKSKPILVTEKEHNCVNACILNLEEGIRSVALPLHILVENQINDAAFLRTVMPITWKNKLESWERSGELRYVQAGGITEMERLLECHFEDDFAKKVFGLPSKVWILSHFLIYDHDGSNEYSCGDNTKKLEKKIAKTLISHHRTWRRTQENYLPKKSLIRIIQSRHTGDEATKLITLIEYHFDQEESIRNFTKLPQLGRNPNFKNEFVKSGGILISCPEDFEEDGILPEMTLLAETIAAAI